MAGSTQYVVVIDQLPGFRIIIQYGRSQHGLGTMPCYFYYYCIIVTCYIARLLHHPIPIQSIHGEAMKQLTKLSYSHAYIRTSTAYTYRKGRRAHTCNAIVGSLYANSKRMRSLTWLYLFPLRSKSATARIPGRSSDTGSTVCPPKSSFSDMSYSCTSTRSKAISGTVRRKLNSSSHTGTQLSSIAFVFFITESAGTPAMPTYHTIPVD